MSKSAQPGPLIVFGQRLPLGSAGPTNPDLAPSLFWGGSGLFDPRGGYNLVRSGALGFLGTTGIAVVNAVPSTISAVNIAASQSPGAGAITLVSATGAGVTVLAAALVVWPSGNTIPVGALALDGLPGLVAFGIPDPATGYMSVSLYDPTKALARNVRITSGGNDSGIVFTVNGYDIYGFPMTEAITGPNATLASGKKTFKFITSITHTGSVATTVTIGTGDVFGFPLRSDFFSENEIFYNSAQITASTGYLAADSTSPATTTTGDVRGTYGVQTASDGTKRLAIFATPSVANIGSNTGLFGVTQV